MKVYPNIFSNNPLDRVSYLRSDPNWIKEKILDKKSIFIFFVNFPVLALIKFLIEVLINL